MSGIVVGFDGSENSRHAMEWAMRQAAIAHSPLTVLTVNEVAVSPWTGEAALMPSDAVLLEQARRAAEDAAGKAAAQAGGAEPVPVTVTAMNGFAGQELVTASHVADLLVIGSRGQLGFPALRVSAIATKVAHYSTCPVVIVPPAS
jgi:nucleotide-binding universal stress UspA family protein